MTYEHFRNSHREENEMENKTKCFRAMCKHGSKTVTTSPRDAANALFQAFPKARKCSVSEGWTDGYCFTMVIGGDESSRYWREVTKRTAAELPESA